jgi:hypothetical protein
MALRDDRDAQRERIVALERELERTRARAEQAEKAEREARAQSAEPRPARDELDELRSRRAADARWAPPLRRRFTVGAVLAVVCADVPVVALFVSGTWALHADDDSVLLYSLAPALFVTPVVWLLATWARAPHPSSALLSSILATAMGWFAVLAGSTDMLWGDVLAEGPMRWLTRGATGLLAIGVHALAVGVWSAEAALSETSSSD